MTSPLPICQPSHFEKLIEKVGHFMKKAVFEVSKRLVSEKDQILPAMKALKNEKEASQVIEAVAVLLQAVGDSPESAPIDVFCEWHSKNAKTLKLFQDQAALFGDFVKPLMKKCTNKKLSHRMSKLSWNSEDFLELGGLIDQQVTVSKKQAGKWEAFRCALGFVCDVATIDRQCTKMGMIMLMSDSVEGDVDANKEEMYRKMCSRVWEDNVVLRAKVESQVKNLAHEYKECDALMDAYKREIHVFKVRNCVKSVDDAQRTAVEKVVQMSKDIVEKEKRSGSMQELSGAVHKAYSVQLSREDVLVTILRLLLKIDQLEKGAIDEAKGYLMRCRERLIECQSLLLENVDVEMEKVSEVVAGIRRKVCEIEIDMRLAKCNASET